MHNNGIQEIRESVRRRLEFIEFRLFWEGCINRSDLRSVFRVSEQQASADLARYQEIAPKNISYDSSLKAYVRREGFRPVVFTPSARQYLSQLRLISDSIVDISETWIGQPSSYVTVPLLRRRTSPEILRPICDAIRDGMSLEIRYRSFTNPEPHWRWITPHSLVFDSRRWHVRAWCHRNENFRDFVIPRIDSTQSLKEGVIDSQRDIEWHGTTILQIAPNPFLDKKQQELIHLEYGMTGGVTEIEVRICIVFYVKEYLRLDEVPSKEHAHRVHLFLANAEEVDAAVNQASAEAKILANADVVQARHKP